MEKDTILFCFGEVDIRAHLIKQSKIQDRPIIEIVKECVDRYFSVILYYKNKGVSVAAWGPIASWHDSKPYSGGPSFGTCLERNIATKEFNRYLEELCENNSIPFVSIYDKMVDENEITNPEYLDNWYGSHIHLSQTAMPLIIDAFAKKGLI